MGYLIMNQKEREQAKAFEQVKEGKITQVEAAARLKITPRWVSKKMKRYLKDNDFGLIHKNRGKVSPRRWDEKEKQLLIELLKSEWHGFGPKFATEKLQEIHSIKVCREVARKAMIQANVWHFKKQKVKHRKRRERKPMVGMMIQLDGSPHDWFEGRAEMCTLLVFIDDATSKILWLEFAESESVVALMQATKNYVLKHGIPQSFYTDFGSVFHVNLNNRENVKKTQWERACKELSIEVNHAHSPQAKGRVERCNQTMQDRLVKDMRLAKISSIQAANEYLQMSSFIEKHNVEFSQKASASGNAHADFQLYDLNDIFSVKETRVLANDYTITFNKRIFQVHDQRIAIVRPKDKIVVSVSLEGTIKLWIRKTKLDFSEIYSRIPRQIQEKIVSNYIQKPCENSRRWISGLRPLAARVG